jgi:hypothetical protein
MDPVRLGVALLMTLALGHPVSHTTADLNLLSWPRMRADRFGCMLEKSFGHRDAKFNCGLTAYQNHGDPCRRVAEYVEGPSFPDSLAAKIDPEVRHVELSWEHGELQSVSFQFNKKVSEAEAKSRLRVAAKLPVNVESVDFQACSKQGPCLTLTGFDHQGAGDVDCGE